MLQACQPSLQHCMAFLIPEICCVNNWSTTFLVLASHNLTDATENGDEKTEQIMPNKPFFRLVDSPGVVVSSRSLVPDL